MSELDSIQFLRNKLAACNSIQEYTSTYDASSIKEDLASAASEYLPTLLTELEQLRASRLNEISVSARPRDLVAVLDQILAEVPEHGYHRRALTNLRDQAKLLPAEALGVWWVKVADALLLRSSEAFRLGVECHLTDWERRVLAIFRGVPVTEGGETK